MQIRWTRKAATALEHIHDYIKEDKPQAAKKVIETIIKSVEILSDHPALGRNGRVLGTREFVVKGTPYIIPYRVKNEYIEILSVMHGAVIWPDNF